MTLLAYLNKFSFTKNETIDLFISGNNDMCKIEILDLSNEKKYFTSQCKVNEQKSPVLCFAEGCDWEISTKIKLDKLDLKPDLYIIKCTQNTNIFYIPFVLLNTENKKDIAVVVNTNTWNAYNRYGGASFYGIKNDLDDNSVKDKIGNCIYNKHTDGLLNIDRPCESAVVSFHRPCVRISEDIKLIFDKTNHPCQGTEGLHLFYGEMFLWFWLKKHNYKFDFLTDQDIEDYDLLKNRKIIILNCHPEYWSHKMYYNLLKSFDKFDTNLIYLGGNGIWRKVYFNQEKNRIEKMGYPYHYKYLNNYKNPFSIDKFAKNNPIEVPPFVILGVFYNSAHIPFTYEDFNCIDNNCWVFKDTKLKVGNIIGEKNNGFKPAGNENDFYTDHPFLKNDKEIHKKYFEHLKIIGRSNHEENYAEIVLQKYKKSNIFSCGSIPFTRCINDEKVTTMLKNVIRKFNR